jgi:hypothetical protein
MNIIKPFTISNYSEKNSIAMAYLSEDQSQKTKKDNKIKSILRPYIN